jgi:hydrogenase expression/formation protein HypE
MNVNDIVTLSLGGRGRKFQKFLKEYILTFLGNDILMQLGDASYLPLKGDYAYSTDSFIVEPDFFKGGDIGKLSVVGTCNDLAVSGAKPLYLSLSFIISEGYSLEKIKRIIESIKKYSEEIGVQVVCGDTKVIPRGEKEQVFINTAGIGKVIKKLNDYKNIREGDRIIFTSDIARHGIAILLEREGIESDIFSDCGHLYRVFEPLDYNKIHFARDASRGGVAAVLNEIAEISGLGFEIDESKISIEDNVKYYCEFFGFDPLQIANEGVGVLIVDKERASEVLKRIQSIEMGRNASIVGEVIGKNKVILKTSIGGKRYVEMPLGEILPRIC